MTDKIQKVQQDSVDTERERIQLVKDNICKDATDNELKMFLYTADRLKLDPFARQIFCVPRWDRNLRRNVYSSQVSVDGFRVVAGRSREYEGQTATQWCGQDGVWKDVWLDSKPPFAARVGAYRKGFREPLYAVALYRSYVQTNKEGAPAALWAKMPELMLAKCAECLALRKAFPEDLSGIYSPEEMAQASNTSDDLAPMLEASIVQAKERKSLKALAAEIELHEEVQIAKALETPPPAPMAHLEMDEAPPFDPSDDEPLDARQFTDKIIMELRSMELPVSVNGWYAKYRDQVNALPKGFRSVVGEEYGRKRKALGMPAANKSARPRMDKPVSQ